MKLKKLCAALLSFAMVCTTISSVFAEKAPTDPKIGIKAEVTGFYDDDTSLPIIDLTVTGSTLAPVVTSGMTVKSVVGVSSLQVKLQLSDKFNTEGVDDNYWVDTTPEGTKLMAANPNNSVFLSWANTAPKKFITSADQKISFVIPQTGNYTIEELNEDMGNLLDDENCYSITLEEYADGAQVYETYIKSNSDAHYRLASAVIGTEPEPDETIKIDETVKEDATAGTRTYKVTVGADLKDDGVKAVLRHDDHPDDPQEVGLTFSSWDGEAQAVFDVVVTFLNYTANASKVSFSIIK